MKGFTLILFTLLFFIVATFVQAAAPINGVVIDASRNTPLAKVQIEVEASGKRKILAEATKANGRFSFDPSEHFNRSELDTHALVLTFSKNTLGMRYPHPLLSISFL